MILSSFTLAVVHFVFAVSSAPPLIPVVVMGMSCELRCAVLLSLLLNFACCRCHIRRG